MALKLAQLHAHQTHRETLIKFLLLLIVLAGYFFYLSQEFSVVTGGFLTALTWSFFVLCTPVADAGFLLDFPMRLLFGVRMLHSEMAVWGIAIGINIVGLSFYPEVYDEIFLTALFKKILLTPYPYWGIIILSGMGTFMSVIFGDEMLDVTQHKDRKHFHKHGFKYRVIFFSAFFMLVIWAYYYLLESMGIDIKL